jgi:two-component system, chemotaxis family, CheB/CheR fusion protein
MRDGKRPHGCAGALEQVFALLRTHAGVDFSEYKCPTIMRRLQRRMMLCKASDLEQYVRRLQADPGEIERLYRDLLIHVTEFFREPQAFEALRRLVFPVIAGEGAERIRIWAAGCSTGEEAYSVAITLLEHLGNRVERVGIRIFGTDVSEAVMQHARAGLYGEHITAHVPPELLRRYFTREETGYRVAQSLRDVCQFERHDLTRDPPFLRLDLIVCRNVLIYLGSALQRKVVCAFHDALRPGGFLVLGSAETVGQHGHLFATVEKKRRVYVRSAAALPRIGEPTA